ncbi:MAG: hypothetical protein LBT85_03640 [Bifidobacteriaceae bacterium]|jgi:5-formyltetrahydrofolate cyclo-ligase|nr:hypothetical protein [Bifidobacteriaceae bacterium]
MNISQAKKELRQKILQQNNLYQNKKDITNSLKSFQKNLSSFLKENSNKKIIGFQALLGEPKLIGINNFIPQTAKIAKKEDFLGFDIYLIPCLAVDKQFNRLGRGSGFYDKLISYIKQSDITQNTIEKNNIKNDNKSSAKFIVCCWTKQIFDKIPFEKHDEKIDGIITEKSITYKS